MTTLVEAVYKPTEDCPPRKKWTREECAELEPTGLWNQQHLELIWGDLISKMGKNKPHVLVVALVHAWLVRTFGAQFVHQDAPIDVAPEDNPTNEPEPDLVVLSKPLWEISSANAKPEDLRLVVEISDTTLSFDRTTKAELYARAGIVEYWIFDIQGRQLIVHRDPQEGLYRSVGSYNEQQPVAPRSAPNQEFRVAEAFSVLK